MFITGAFVSHEGWNPWKAYFESKGYKVYVSPWPQKNGTAAEQRAKQPNAALSKVTFADVTNHYAQLAQKIAKENGERPIAIGHSLGGIITQQLLSRDLVAAGIAIHSAPPQGVIPYQLSFLKSGWPALNFFKSIDETYLMSFEHFQYAFANGLPLEVQKKAYEENAVPESRRVIRNGLTSMAAVDWKHEHEPLLFISSPEDHFTPASMNKNNQAKYNTKNSIEDYKEFPGKNHYVLGLPNWHEEADYILGWLGN